MPIPLWVNRQRRRRPARGSQAARLNRELAIASRGETRVPASDMLGCVSHATGDAASFRLALCPCCPLCCLCPAPGRATSALKGHSSSNQPLALPTLHCDLTSPPASFSKRPTSSLSDPTYLDTIRHHQLGILIADDDDDHLISHHPISPVQIAYLSRRPSVSPASPRPYSSGTLPVATYLPWLSSRPRILTIVQH